MILATDEDAKVKDAVAERLKLQRVAQNLAAIAEEL